MRAEKYLKALGPAVAGTVLPYTPRPQWVVRIAPLRILIHVKHPAGIPALWRALNDEEPLVRMVAHKGLRTITGGKVAFKHDGPAQGRTVAISKWRAYLEHKGLLLHEAL